MSELIHDASAKMAFFNAFWIVVGIIVGACIQFLLHWVFSLKQRKNAKQVLSTEVALNLEEHMRFLERLGYLRDRVVAGQISPDDLFVTMQGFDYSVVNPLVNSGHFHMMLGHEKVNAYFEFMRFFNNQNAIWANSMLRTEHERGKSLDFIDWMERRSKALEAKLREALS